MALLNICASRLPGMTHAEYSRYLKDNHARLVLGTEAVVQHLSSYVQQHVFDAAYRNGAPVTRFDSVSHISAPSVAEHMAAVATAEYKEIVAPDEPNFSDGSTVLMLMLEEHPLEIPVRGLSQYRLLHYLAGAAETSNDALQGHWADAHAALLNAHLRCSNPCGGPYCTRRSRPPRARRPTAECANWAFSKRKMPRR